MDRLWSYTRRYWQRLLWGCVMLALTNATTMAIPQLFRASINGIQQKMPSSELQTLGLMLIGTALVGAVFRALSRVHIFYAARDVERDMRCDFYTHLTKLEPAFYHTHPTGDLMARATFDLTQVRLMLGPGFLNIVNTVIAYCVAVPLMWKISPILTCAAFSIYPPAVLLMRLLGKKVYQRTRVVQDTTGKIASFIQETLSGISVIRAYNVHTQQIQKCDTLSQKYYTENLRLARARSMMFKLVMSLSNMGVLIAVYMGSREALKGTLSLGDIVAVVEYMAILSWPTFALGWVISTWQRGAAAMERINDIFERQPSLNNPHTPVVFNDYSVRMHNLTVRYHERTVLNNISLTIPQGTSVAFVGPIGCGKSTLLKSLLRFVQTPSNTLFIGTHDITHIPLKQLRSSIGYVPQNPLLFSKSLKMNVAFGSPQTSTEQILEALGHACLLSDISALPEGIETPVGERGITLSGGQKQRTAIARAWILNTPILLLDDALSAVDTRTEKYILEHLRTTRAHLTTCWVTHRISTAQHADMVYVLDDGQIKEQGTHASLIALNGLYAQMAQQQSTEKNP